MFVQVLSAVLIVYSLSEPEEGSAARPEEDPKTQLCTNLWGAFPTPI